MKSAFGVFLLIHGVAHGVGFLTVSGLVKSEDQPSDPTFLLTRFPADHAVFKAMSAIWLIAMAAFIVAGVAVITGSDLALAVTVVAAIVSVVLSVIWVKAAPFGLVANIIVIVALVIPWISDRVFP